MFIDDESKTCLQCKDNVGGPALLLGILIPFTLLVGGAYWHYVGLASQADDTKTVRIAPIRKSSKKSETTSFVKTASAAPAEKAPAAVPALSLAGVWSHTFMADSGQKRTLVLKAIYDDEGELVVGYLQQYFSYKPILERAFYSDGKLELDFGMVTYGKETPSGKRMEYRLKQEGSGFVGTINQTGKDPARVDLDRWPENETPHRRKATID